MPVFGRFFVILRRISKNRIDMKKILTASNIIYSGTFSTQDKPGSATLATKPKSRKTIDEIVK